MEDYPVTAERENRRGVAARFRLFVFSYVDGGYLVERNDHRDCDVADLIADANYYYTDTGALWSLALVHEGSDRVHLTWLSGYDYRHAPETYEERRARRTMQSRYLAARALRGEPVVLPDGLRVIRMFPEWMGGPLWESFTDNYPADPTRLGLSQSATDDLEAWNDTWGARDVNEPLADPEAWVAEGRRLHAQVQQTMAGIAEVAPEFLPPERYPIDRI